MFYTEIDSECLVSKSLQSNFGVGETVSTGPLKTDDEANKNDVSHVVQDNNQDMCGICQEPCKRSDSCALHSVIHVDNIVELPCKHLFHYMCLRNSAKYNIVKKSARTCALCRKSFPPVIMPASESVYIASFHLDSKTKLGYVKNVDWETIVPGTEVVLIRGYDQISAKYSRSTNFFAYVHVNGTETRIGKSRVFLKT